jgi:hypothetical protein
MGKKYIEFPLIDGSLSSMYIGKDLSEFLQKQTKETKKSDPIPKLFAIWPPASLPSFASVQNPIPGKSHSIAVNRTKKIFPASRI